MPTKEECVKAAAAFRTKYAVDGSDENLIATIHLVNRHGVNPQTAISRSSQSGNDHGIDAWHYLESQQTLYIYQSKLAESKPVVLKGLSDLLEAANWLFKVIGTGELDRVPVGNPSLYNLYLLLSTVRTDIKMINLRLLSPMNQNLLEDSKECCDFDIQRSSCELNTFVNNHLQGKLTFGFSEYDLVPGTPPPPPVNPIPVIPETRLEIKKGTHLDLAYVPLYSLVELYRRRGNILFDRNVRLSLVDVRGTKERLKNPMTATLDQITGGHMDPKLFTFYHVGITIAASRSLPGDAHSPGFGVPKRHQWLPDDYDRNSLSEQA